MRYFFPIALILIITLTISGVVWHFKNVEAEQLGADKIPQHLKLKVDKEDIIFSKEKGGVAEYLYNSGVEVAKEKNEKIEMRTKNAKFFDKGNGKTEGRFYAGEPFYKKNNKWYQTETATTTKEVFEQLAGYNLGGSGDPVYSGAGDGHIYYAHSNWDTAHDAAIGTADDNNNEDVTSAGTWEQIGATSYSIFRGFCPIDTSSLPDDITITGASLSIYVSGKTNGDDDGDDWINIVQTDQSSNTSLANGDYNNCGQTDNPTEGASRIDLGSINTSSYNTWTLNATGLGWISVSGYTKLGIREGHDAIDSPPGTDLYSKIGTRWSEYTGTGSDPYLTIEYTTPSPSPVIDYGDNATTTIKNGTLNIKNGTLLIK